MKLKFRVFDLLSKSYLHSYADNGESFQYFHTPSDWMFIGIDWFIQCSRLESLKRFKVEQFSGLLDSQGKEVYEGDLVEVTYISPDYMDDWEESEPYFIGGKKFVGEVIRSLGGSINLEIFVRKGELTPFDIYFPLFYVEQGKVVGNVLTKKD